MDRDDAVLPIVRITGAVIAIALVIAVIILYGLPGQTDRHWSWTINPELTAMFMAAGYASGAYFFVRVLIGNSWRSVCLGFLPITAFTSFLLIATILHWGNFNHGHISFWLWIGLYAVTPFFVPFLWYLNRNRDPGHLPGELELPAAVRGFTGAAGALLITLALVMLISPSTVIDDWLWPLSELTARVIAAYIALTGGLLVNMAVDARWTASKVMVETFMVGTVLMFIAIIRDWGSLDPSQAVRWGYLISVGVGLVLLLALYSAMESRARRDTPAPVREEPAEPAG